jgi:hypothetical protein
MTTAKTVSARHRASRAVRALIRRLTYANVVASLALFVALGGASYGAIALPANSVGSRQLRAAAVGLGDLRFPLGTVGMTDHTIEDLTKGACNSPVQLREDASPPCLPPVRGGQTPGREVRITLRTAGLLLVSATVNLKDEGTPTSDARIAVGLNVDRKRVAETEITITGGQLLQVPIQTLASVLAGKHTAGLSVSAQYDSAGPGDVIISNASVIVSAAPHD